MKMVLEREAGYGDDEVTKLIDKNSVFIVCG